MQTRRRFVSHWDSCAQNESENTILSRPRLAQKSALWSFCPSVRAFGMARLQTVAGCCLLACLVAQAAGRVNKLTLKDDSRAVFSVETFGFARGGVAELHVRNAALPGAMRAGFILLKVRKLLCAVSLCAVSVAARVCPVLLHCRECDAPTIHRARLRLAWHKPSR